MNRHVIRLTGKSLKGKNRIREHGSWWIVVRDLGNSVRPNDILVQPFDGRDLRWVNLTNDKDFTVTQ